MSRKQLSMNLVLIDPKYKNFLEDNKVRDRIFNYGLSVQVYEKIVNISEYNTLVEFCHFISNFNCLSIILDMTGIPRRQYYLAEHQTNYLYISPSKCDMNTQDIIYNPILISETIEDINEGNPRNNIIFYRVEQEEELYEHLNYDDSVKLDFVVSILKNRLWGEILFKGIIVYENKTAG